MSLFDVSAPTLVVEDPTFDLADFDPVLRREDKRDLGLPLSPFTAALTSHARPIHASQSPSRRPDVLVDLATPGRPHMASRTSPVKAPLFDSPSRTPKPLLSQSPERRPMTASRSMKTSGTPGRQALLSLRSPAQARPDTLRTEKKSSTGSYGSTLLKPAPINFGLDAGDTTTLPMHLPEASLIADEAGSFLAEATMTDDFSRIFAKPSTMIRSHTTPDLDRTRDLHTLARGWREADTVAILDETPRRYLAQPTMTAAHTSPLRRMPPSPVRRSPTKPLPSPTKASASVAPAGARVKAPLTSMPKPTARPAQSAGRPTTAKLPPREMPPPAARPSTAARPISRMPTSASTSSLASAASSSSLSSLARPRAPVTYRPPTAGLKSLSLAPAARQSTAPSLKRSLGPPAPTARERPLSLAPKAALSRSTGPGAQALKPSMPRSRSEAGGLALKREKVPPVPVARKEGARFGYKA